MSNQNPLKETILSELSKEILEGNQVGNILHNPSVFPTKLIEDLSLATAQKYWNGKISYIEGDTIMNNLYIYWMTRGHLFTNSEFSSIAWDCYEAFDAGEFYRDNEDRSIDPSEKYTKPLIESLLKEHQLIP